MPIITASQRGQIVIPKEIRKRLQIDKGKKLFIKECDGNAIITPLPNDPAEHFCGIFKDKTSLTEDLLKERTKDRHREINKGT
jgi:AbrB family looped-hinge helix DNA binding protein